VYAGGIDDSESRDPKEVPPETQGVSGL
jgi:hypothetical protein